MTTFTELINSGKPVLVDFFAEWCQPCKMMTPVLTELKERLGDQLTILKINVDRNPGVAAQYQIQGVPTLVLFRNGHIAWRQSGVLPVDQLQQIVSSYVS
jgi:thioredoxin 1